MLKTNGLQYKIDIWLKAHRDTENKKKSKLQLVTREHSDKHWQNTSNVPRK